MNEILLKDVPVEWIFEFYLAPYGLGERLTGQEVAIRSPFNPNDRFPSFTLFYEKNKKYLFRDFSHGIGGDHVTLVVELSVLWGSKMSRGQAIRRICTDYREYLINGGSYTVAEMKIYQKYRVCDFRLRNWQIQDKGFWKDRFRISRNTLEFFNIAPLLNFTMSKLVEDREDVKTITRELMYGYFRKDGSLGKIYQPSNKGCKFIKVRGFIQGEDQLRFDQPSLLITKSLKDCAGFRQLAISGWEVIAPDSEGELIPKLWMDTIGIKYRNKRILNLN